MKKVGSGIKITKHCELDQFVSMVDQRIKHSSGLAIHTHPAIPAIASKPQQNYQFPKSSHYKRVEEQYKQRAMPDPMLVRNIGAKEQAKQLTNMRLKQYQKNKLKGNLSLTFDLEVLSIPPDPKRIAQLRHLYFVGSFPNEYTL